MKIAIKFGDNDFGNTFFGILETIHEIYKYNEIEPTKEQLVNLINEISFGIYIARQHDYTSEKNHFESRRMRNYLKIDEAQILLNEEVDEYQGNESQNWHNSETFILDTDLNYPNNKCVYSI